MGTGLGGSALVDGTGASALSNAVLPAESPRPLESIRTSAMVPGGPVLTSATVSALPPSVRLEPLASATAVVTFADVIMSTSATPSLTHAMSAASPVCCLSCPTGPSRGALWVPSRGSGTVQLSVIPSSVTPRRAATSPPAGSPGDPSAVDATACSPGDPSAVALAAGSPGDASPRNVLAPGAEAPRDRPSGWASSLTARGTRSGTPHVRCSKTGNLANTGAPKITCSDEPKS